MPTLDQELEKMQKELLPKWIEKAVRTFNFCLDNPKALVHAFRARQSLYTKEVMTPTSSAIAAGSGHPDSDSSDSESKHDTAPASSTTDTDSERLESKLAHSSKYIKKIFPERDKLPPEELEAALGSIERGDIPQRYLQEPRVIMIIEEDPTKAGEFIPELFENIRNHMSRAQKLRYDAALFEAEGSIEHIEVSRFFKKENIGSGDIFHKLCFTFTDMGDDTKIQEAMAGAKLFVREHLAKEILEREYRYLIVQLQSLQVSLSSTDKGQISTLVRDLQKRLTLSKDVDLHVRMGQLATVCDTCYQALQRLEEKSIKEFQTAQQELMAFLASGMLDPDVLQTGLDLLNHYSKEEMQGNKKRLVLALEGHAQFFDFISTHKKTISSPTTGIENTIALRAMLEPQRKDVMDELATQLTYLFKTIMEGHRAPILARIDQGKGGFFTGINKKYEATYLHISRSIELLIGQLRIFNAILTQNSGALPPPIDHDALVQTIAEFNHYLDENKSRLNMKIIRNGHINTIMDDLKQHLDNLCELIPEAAAIQSLTFVRK